MSADAHDALSAFDPVVRRWFVERVGRPTAVQAAAWPRIARGEHVLATAPTGSGKTLAAFLWGLDRLLTGAWTGGAIRVLYVSPLKALGYDIERNLMRPLAELTAAFRASGREVPAIEVRTRTGDTPGDERRRAVRHPPEILITTPESLNVLLTSASGRSMLRGVRVALLDEVHAIAGGKRGVHLITAIERVAALVAAPDAPDGPHELQRVALSATVRPLERIAAWVGGWERDGDEWSPRPVAIVDPPGAKTYELSVRFPFADAQAEPEPTTAEDGLWRSLVGALRERIQRNRSTLVFANSRRMVEKLARMINEDEPERTEGRGAEPLVWAHHGSLAREVRQLVEERLKRGELRGVIATNSLELGIDIGDLDEVLQVQVPFGVASAVQRIGRAGHGVGETSRGTLFPLVPAELVDAAVCVRAVQDGDVEPITPPVAPLDVLAQVVVSMTATEPWPIDAIEDVLRHTAPYHELPRRHFDLVLGMLSGRYAGARVRALDALVTVDEIDGTVRGRPGSDRRVYLSGGTIPDRGYFRLRNAATGAPIGELDEEFVWERAVGDAFTLGVQTWRVEAITHNDVLVSPARARVALAPFWRAEALDRGARLAERTGLFLEHAEPRLSDPPPLIEELRRDFQVERAGADALVDELVRQRQATGALPHRHRLVVEHAADPSGEPGASWTLLHTLWGGRVNRPYALALEAAAQELWGAPVQVLHDDRCVVMTLPDPARARDLLEAVTADRLDALLRARLAATGFFGARFREAAACALLLPREGFRRRTPLWLSRQRAKEMLDAVRPYDDFPLVLEAWRSCLADEFELDPLRERLRELRDGAIAVHEVRTAEPSPFAANVVWRRTNELMYADDVPVGSTRVRPDLLRELVFSPDLRPRLDPALCEEFRRKVQRVFPGYAPRGADELFDWLLERTVIAENDWRELALAIHRDHALDERDLVGALAGRVTAARLPGAGRPVVVTAVQNVPRLAAALDVPLAKLELLHVVDRTRDAAAEAGLRARAPFAEAAGDLTVAPTIDVLVELVADVLRFEGPLDPGIVARRLGLYAERVQEVIEILSDADRVVVDELTAGAPGTQVCDAENLERLLRMTRARARPVFEPRPLDEWPLFVASWQDFGDPRAGSPEDVRAALERLFGWPAPAALWETDLLPARVAGYQPGWLDGLLAETGLTWFGCGTERIAFCLDDERDLYAGAGSSGDDGADDDEAAAAADIETSDLDRVLPPGPGHFPFEELIAYSHLPSTELSKKLWALAWAGCVSNDGFAALRRGVETGFKPADPERAHRPTAPPRARRFRFDRWKTTRPFGGAWFRLPEPAPPQDALEEDELARERVRALLDRYGIVFRELAARELPALRWGRVFRALRLMELSGEVVAGPFFDGLGGVQFASPAAFRRLEAGLEAERSWWVHALDPASPAGLGPGLFAGVPRRAPATHLAFRGARLVVVSERRGRRVEIKLAADDPALPAALDVFTMQFRRTVRPVNGITIETINGEPAASSPYVPAFAALFVVEKEMGTITLRRRYS